MYKTAATLLVRKFRESNLPPQTFFAVFGWQKKQSVSFSIELILFDSIKPQETFFFENDFFEQKIP